MVITLPRAAALESLRPRLEAKLEQEYEGQTERLAALLEHGRDEPRRRAPRDLETATADARAALADVALALRRMAEGRYGTCERCAGDIDTDRLESRPAVRYCLACTPSSAA